MSFHFDGSIDASKSLLNRLLIIQSFAPSGCVAIHGDSKCDDVDALRRALPRVLEGRGEAADCGDAGTTFRFLALRAARVPGKHLLVGSAALLARPQRALIETLAQLQVKAELSPGGLVIESDGWRPPADGALVVDRSQSSQFASAVLLSAWGLEFDLRMQIERGVSESYFAMTEALVRRAGMRLTRAIDGEVSIPRHSSVSARELAAEPDLSSCFAVAALAALGSRSSARFENFPSESLQPDFIFVRLLEEMGAVIERQADGALRVRGTDILRPIDVDLGQCPDLFPVLAVLCGFARGRSRLHGAPHLVFKESSRIRKTAELLRGLGRRVEEREDGLIVDGCGREIGEASGWSYDPSGDHRLAMAAALARLAGSSLRLQNRGVVNKSFPEFWSIFEAGGGRWE